MLEKLKNIVNKFYDYFVNTGRKSESKQVCSEKLRSFKRELFAYYVNKENKTLKSDSKQ